MYSSSLNTCPVGLCIFLYGYNVTMTTILLMLLKQWCDVNVTHGVLLAALRALNMYGKIKLYLLICELDSVFVFLIVLLNLYIWKFNLTCLLSCCFKRMWLSRWRWLWSHLLYKWFMFWTEAVIVCRFGSTWWRVNEILGF